VSPVCQLDLLAVVEAIELLQDLDEGVGIVAAGLQVTAQPRLGAVWW
jgi:hypothetical protein